LDNRGSKGVPFEPDQPRGGSDQNKGGNLARYTGSVCRICRRENLKLFLKGDRCYSDKCAFDRRSYPPGRARPAPGGKTSDYGIQLREKQKVKRMYGLSEKQFRLFFTRADARKGSPAPTCWSCWNASGQRGVPAGFVNSRTQGRHFVRTTIFWSTAKRSTSLLPDQGGRCVEVREKAARYSPSDDAMDAVVRRGVPSGSTGKRKF
jgi:small subunit ribosomal protein S4